MPKLPEKTDCWSKKILLPELEPPPQGPSRLLAPLTPDPGTATSSIGRHPANEEARSRMRIDSQEKAAFRRGLNFSPSLPVRPDPDR
jgi:hypothetical protein